MTKETVTMIDNNGKIGFVSQGVVYVLDTTDDLFEVVGDFEFEFNTKMVTVDVSYDSRAEAVNSAVGEAIDALVNALDAKWVSLTSYEETTSKLRDALTSAVEHVTFKAAYGVSKLHSYDTELESVYNRLRNVLDEAFLTNEDHKTYMDAIRTFSPWKPLDSGAERASTVGHLLGLRRPDPVLEVLAELQGGDCEDDQMPLIDNSWVDNLKFVPVDTDYSVMITCAGLKRPLPGLTKVEQVWPDPKDIDALAA